MSPFQIPPACNAYSKHIPGKTFGPNWSLDWSFAETGWCSTIAPNGVAGPSKGTPNRLSYGVFPSVKRDLERFADSSNTPWYPPTIRHLDWTAIAPQMSLPWFCALLFRQSNLFLICVVDVRWFQIIPRKTCQIPRYCQCKWLSASSSAPRTSSLGSSGSPGKFLFCTSRIVTTVLPNLLPQRRIDDWCVIHFLHWEFCDPQLFESPKVSASGPTVPAHLLREALLFSSSSRYRSLGLSGSECRYTVLTRVRFHFCSRLHW